MPRPPDFQSIELPIGGGLQQDVGEMQVSAPALLECTDFSVFKGKRYEKRHAAGQLGKDGIGSSDVTNAVFDHNGTLCQLNTDGVYTYDAYDDAWNNPYTNGVFPTDVQRMAAVSVTKRACNSDIAYNGGFICLVWEESEGAQCYASIYLESTGELLKGPIKLGSNLKYSPRVVAGSNYFVVFAHATDPRTSSLNDIAGQSCDITSFPFTFGSQNTVATNTIMRDVVGSASYTHVFMVTGGTSNVRRITASAPSTTHTNALAGTDSLGGLYHQVGTALHVVVRNAGGDHVGYRLSQTDLSTLTGPTTLLAAASVPAWLNVAWFSVRDMTSTHLIVQASTAVATRTGTNPLKFGVYSQKVLMSNHTVAESWGTPRSNLRVRSSRPGTEEPVFVVDNHLGSINATVAEGTEYPALFLATLNKDLASQAELKIQARFMADPSEALDASSAATDNGVHLGQSIVGADAKSIWFAATRVVRTASSFWDTGNQSVVELYRAKVVNADERTICRANDLTLIGGGVLGTFDGQRAAESSFLGPPIITNIAINAGGAAATGFIATITIILTYIDACGRIHRSPPSNVSGLDNTAGLNNGTAKLRFIPPPGFAVNGDNGAKWLADMYVYIGATSSENDRHYAASFIPTPVTGDEALWYFDFAIGAASNPTTEVDYGQSTDLLSDPPYTAIDVRTSKDRVFYLDAQRDKVRFSKPLTAVYGPEFPDENYILLPPDGGLAVALEVFDDRLIIFKEKAIFTLSIGAGPDATGGGPQFQVPRRIPGDLGCIARESVVVVPSGAMFQSQRGIYLLDRNLAIQPIGVAVQDVIGTNKVSAACVIPAASEARFFLESAPGTTATSCAVFNYDAGIWYKHATVGTASAWAMNGDNYNQLNSGEENTVYAESVTASYFGEHPSADQFIDPAISTAWIDLNGIQGYQSLRSVQIAGNWYSEDVKVELFYDYSSTVGTTYYFRESSFGSPGSTAIPFQLSCAPSGSTGKCRAIRVRVSGSHTYADADPGKGFTLEGIQLEVKVKRGSNQNISSTFKTTNP